MQGYQFFQIIVNEYLDLNESLSSKLSSLSDEFDYLKGIENPLSTILDQSNFNDLGLSKDLYADLSNIDFLKNNIISGDSYLTLENSINPDIFKSAKDRLISAFDTGSIDLDKLKANLGLTSQLIQNPDDTYRISDDEDQ